MNNIYILNDYINYGLFPSFVDLSYLIAILFAILTILNKNPIVSVLFLIGLFLTVASLLILIGFTFLGLSYVLVYVGAITILFLFILMLINIRLSELSTDNNNDVPLAILTSMVFYFIMGQVVDVKLLNSWARRSIYDMDPSVFTEQLIDVSSKFWDSSLVDIQHISGLGNVMYSSHAIWLILVAIILLLAMVGAIVITINQTLPRSSV